MLSTRRWAGTARDLVTLRADGGVADRGCGSRYPSGHRASYRPLWVEVVFTKLHAGGKFGAGSYNATGGLHGVGSRSSTRYLVGSMSRSTVIGQPGHVVPPRRPGTFDGTGRNARFSPGGTLRKIVGTPKDRPELGSPLAGSADLSCRTRSSRCESAGRARRDQLSGPRTGVQCHRRPHRRGHP